MAIDKNSKYYQSLLNKWYSDSQISQMYSAVEWGQSAKDAVANVKPANTQTTTNTSTNTNTTRANTNIAKPEYQWTGTVTTPTPSYQHQWEGNYVYNPTSWYYEKQWTTSTATTSTTPTSTGTTGTDKNAQARQLWDSKSYQEQQDLLNKNPWLKENVVKIWWTIKENPNQWTVNTETPKGWDTNQWGWDYQDNSPERMQQIADNLERMYQTDPGLFANEQTFRDFFINWVNRTPEQEKFLMDYYRNRKVYNEYDWYTSEAVWGMYAYWKVPENYLTYVKNSNPQRYAEIMDAKDKEQDKIKNNSSYDSILEQNWFESTNNLDWQKREWLLVDKNNDLIDDRLYHEPTEEERQKVDRINEIDARMLEINNALKWAEEDLTKAYPWATKATIMALVNDRSQNLLREKDDLMVERTQLAWTVEYLQSERQNEDKAGQQTIANLQKNLWMYYDYTPEWMSELAQAQYAATNVTLDQAENWTDTQKQMALDSVLSDYFDKYGSIIQRSKSQVINDVMNYAKKNGVSLSQALQENFIKPLQAKPEYSTLSSGWSLTADKWAKLSDNTLYNVTTWEIMSANGSNIGSLFWNYGSTSEALTSWIEWFIDWLLSWWYKIAGDWGSWGSKIRSWWCWTVVNDYLGSIWDNNIKLTEANDIAPYATGKTPTIWWIAYFDWTQSRATPATKEHGHVGIVVWGNWDTITVLESNEWTWLRYNTYKKSDVTGYYVPDNKKARQTAVKDNLNAKFSWDPDWNPNWYFDSLWKKLEELSQNWKIDMTDTKYKSLKEDYNITDQELNQMATNYADAELITQWGRAAVDALEYAMKTYDYLYGDNVNTEIWWLPNPTEKTGWYLWRVVWGRMKWTDTGVAKKQFDTLLSTLTLQELQNAKRLWATFWSLSDAEWKILWQAATALDWDAWDFKWQLEDLINSLYDAAIDWRATMPMWWEESKANQMMQNRIQNGTSLWKYNEQGTKGKNNDVNNPWWNNEQTDYDNDWDNS